MICYIALTVSRNMLRGVGGSFTIRKSGHVTKPRVTWCQWSGIIHVSPRIALLVSWEVIRSLWCRVDAENRNGLPAPFASSLFLLLRSMVAAYVTSLSGEDPSIFALEALSLSLSNGTRPRSDFVRVF
jgi:hypothetical protein